MEKILYYSTNNREEKVNFETALLNGIASNYGLYMMDRKEIPMFSHRQIFAMRLMSYAEIAFQVLRPYLWAEIPDKDLQFLLNDAYREDAIPTYVQPVTGKSHILWLTNGPTFSFKDYAARFYGRMINYFLGKRGLKRVVIVATSGDTGGAIADALCGLDNVTAIIFYPNELISSLQRVQMTTLGKNIYAFAVNGNFDVCQALAKLLNCDKDFAEKLFGDENIFTSANSISIGRLLPQAVYPFFAYSRIMNNSEPFIASIPSGNFGDMVGTVIAKEMGLPVSKILCGVNENKAFPDFLNTGIYTVYPSKKCPSSAMDVSHPSNLARLIDFYGGHIHDERDPITKRVTKEGVITRHPDLRALRKDVFSIGVRNEQHYQTMADVYKKHGIVLDPHGAVGWRILDAFLEGKHDRLAVVYETANPAKFPEDVFLGVGVYPEIPPKLKEQREQKEIIYTIDSFPDSTPEGLKLSQAQIEETKEKLIKTFS